jgi:hypothetical protein
MGYHRRLHLFGGCCDHSSWSASCLNGFPCGNLKGKRRRGSRVAYCSKRWCPRSESNLDDLWLRSEQAQIQGPYLASKMTPICTALSHPGFPRTFRISITSMSETATQAVQQVLSCPRRFSVQAGGVKRLV